MRYFFNRLIRFSWLALASVQLLSVGVHGVTIGFQYDHYTVTPGSSVVLVTQLSQPVPNGLQGYAFKMTFDPGTVTLSEDDILVTPALDFGLFAPGATKEVSADFASAAGFTEIGQPAYFGTEFVMFTIKIPETAQEGYHMINLEPLISGANNFVDGNTQSIDESLVFGSTLLEIRGPRPEESFADLKVEIVGGSAKISFEALAGWPYTIQVSTGSLSNWQSVMHVVPQNSGLYEFIDTINQIQTPLFYRVVAGTQ